MKILSLGIALLGTTMLLANVALAAPKKTAAERRSLASIGTSKTVCGQFLMDTDDRGHVLDYMINTGSDGPENANHIVLEFDDSNMAVGHVAMIRNLQVSLLNLMTKGKKYCVTGKVSRSSDPSEPAYISGWDSVRIKR